MFSNFFQNLCRLWDNVEKCGRVRQGTDINIMRRMRFACSTTKATDTHTEFVVLFAFPRLITFIRTLPILKQTSSAVVSRSQLRVHYVGIYVNAEAQIKW